MPAPHATPHSPPPHATTTTTSAAVAGSNKPPPPPSPSSSSSVLHQVGSRQGTRTRTRTRRNVSSSASGSHRTPRYTNEDHPMAPHNLAARGYHSFRCLGVPFHVKQRYTFVRELGIGAYGCVALCRDEVLDCNVAIKKVTRIFEKDVLARRALREVALLRHIGMCDNATALLDFDTAFIDFSEIYLVLSASEADLSQIIRSGQALSDAHHQYFMAQILRGVRYMHAAKVIHRDLKPSNLLVNGDCALRICDFGLARAYADSDQFLAPPVPNDEPEAKSRTSISSSVDGDRAEAQPSSEEARSSTSAVSHPQQQPQSGSARSPSPVSDLHVQLYKTDSKGKQKRLNFPGGPLTGYVATRWYRAPEVMLCFREGYGPEMDMWSVGCILAELISGAPIFGGKDYVDQIARINNVLGSPSETVLDKIGSERAKTYIKSLPNMPPVPLEKLYPNANPEALDLVAKLLTWDPDQRLTAEQALKHPWLKAYHESNARWQPPQPFNKFAEVEFINSLRQFKASLQREADEMRMELEELEREEMEFSPANDEHVNGTCNGDHNEAHQGGKLPQQSNGNAEEITTTTNGNAEADDQAAQDEQNQSGSGNVQRADEAVDQKAQSERRSVDADAPHLDPSLANGDVDADGDALSCSASTRSGHLPADTASSSSSIHTPSSTSGASADEAEPPSPRLYDACRMSTALKSRAEHLEEGKALRKPQSFFRLGHEAEGRLFDPLHAQEHNDVFMPHQVLTVAHGLIDYQSTAVVAVREMTFLPSESAFSRDTGMLSRSATIKAAMSGGSGGGAAAGEAGANSGSSPSGASGPRASGGGRGGDAAASTSSIGQSLLDDAVLAPSDSSSSSLKSLSSQRHGKQLVILQDSLVQSSVSLMRELITRTVQRNHAVLLVTALRRPQTYLDGALSDRVAVIEAASLGNDYETDDSAIRTINELVDRVQSELAALNSRVSKTTVLIDSLNAIAHATAQDGGVASATKVVRETLGSIGASSRLVVGVQRGGVEVSTYAGLVANLHSPLIWGPSNPAVTGSASVAGGTVLSAAVHPPALLRHIFKQYGLKPPSSSLGVRKALGFSGGIDQDAEKEEVDARFWDVLRNVASRGPMGVPAYEAGGGAAGWWSDESATFESLSIGHGPEGGSEKKGSDALSSGGTVISLADLLNPVRSGYAVLELHFQSRNGKKYEELLALVTGQDGSVTLVPLDMVDRSVAVAASARVSAPAPGLQSPSTSAPQPSSTPASAEIGGGNAHSSMLQTLPFNLGETLEQRQRRETVRLPYAYHQHPAQQDEGGAALRGSTGNATIFFEPEQDDDEDDEDPDDDLDL